MKVWIDCSNSPHPLLFAPVARRLEQGGHEVMVTARDNAQTVALARERWPTAQVIGAGSPRGKWSKAAILFDRVTDLGRWARRMRPDVALSHNSYGQIVAARALRIVLTYKTGDVTKEITLPDYYADLNPSDKSLGYLAHDLAKWGNKNNMTEKDHHNIDLLKIETDPGKILKSITIKKDKAGYLVFWAAAGEKT